MEAAGATLVDLLRLHARERPEAPAYVFLPDHTDQPLTLTYRALDRHARSIAASLQAEGAERERVLLLLPPGLEYVASFFGCLYAGSIAVPAYPTLSRRRRDRLEAIALDARARFAVAIPAALGRLDELTAGTDRRPLRMLDYASCIDHAADAWRPPPPNPAAVAFLQYTSGSTSSPRGVMVSHHNLMYNEDKIARAMGHDARTSIVSWLPPHHDMGLIGSLLQPIYVGSSCIFMSPVSFLRRPMRWLETVARYRAHTSGAPDFAYRLCVEKSDPEQRSRLDLSHWKVAFVGAEPVREETIERFAGAFESCGFRRQAFFPCYGLAEATLVVTASAAGVAPAICPAPDSESRGGAASCVSCGKALPDMEVALVDPKRLNRVGPGQVGEIWIRGPAIALGYWDRPDATEETFGARLAGSGDGPFLRTGDLGFFREDQLYITGRLKDLMIFRGVNHYPQDIEWTVARSHRSVRKDHTAAFSIQREGEEQLVIVTEVERTAREDRWAEVVSAVREAVAAEHELAVHAVVILKWGSLPMTSSGKVQRHVCRERFLNDSLEAVMADILEPVRPAGPVDFPLRSVELRATPDEERLGLIETSLVAFLARILNVPASRIGTNQSLPALGLDSLLAVDLQGSLERNLGISLPMAALLAAPGVPHLAQAICDELKAPSHSRPSPPPADDRDVADHPLSSGQQALWFLHQLMPENPAYHIAQALRIEGTLDAAVLHRCLQALVDRHESLRSVFLDVRGEPVIRILNRVDLILQDEDVSSLSQDQLQARLRAEALRRFNLENGPLLRACLFGRSPRESIFLLCVHHIVADGWSLRLLVSEMAQLYEAYARNEAGPLPDLAVRYVDYARIQRERLNRNDIQSQLAYWKSQLADAGALRLPTDHRRSATPTFRGGSVSFAVSETLTADLQELSRREGATLFMTVLAVFKVLLHHRSRQDDIVVGTDFINRSGASSRDLVGYLVNQLVLRTDLSGNPTCREIIARVRAVALAAYGHHDVPFQQLVSWLRPNRELGKNPLFQVMVTFRNIAIGPITLGGSRVTPLEIDEAAEKFDLTLALEVTPNGLRGSLGYDKSLFERATVESIVRDFELLLGLAIADPDQTLASLRTRLSSNPGATAPHRMTGKMAMLPASFRSIKPRKISVSPNVSVVREELAPGPATFPMIRPGRDGLDLSAWAREHRQYIDSELLAHGALLLRGFGVKSIEAFEGFAQTVSSHLFSQNGEHPRESISGHIQTPVAYPAHQKLLWHNENSFNHSWPTKLWFCCLQPAERGGETPIVDSREVFKLIDPAIRAKFIDKKVMYVRNYGAGVGLDWRTVFGTDHPDEAESFCAANHLQWEWKDGGRLLTRCVLPAAIRHPRTGQMTWFNQAQHWHLSCLQAEMREALLALYPDQELPRNCFYGDGSAIEDSVMKEILEVYRMLEVTFPWQEADVLMLDNLLVAHARNPFVGERKLLVAMGDMESYDSIGGEATQSL